ncbi:MAG TPA: chemotaxis protein CheB [Anaeromyxobacter sp.]|nr:chemotaxis protein CheB [Anaeromyxobacter sp.]
MANRDIVVVGASAGGVELLLELVGELPRSLPAAIFVVVHTSSGYLSTFPDLLTSRGGPPAVHPNHGDQVSSGHIYVAPPDMQLLVRLGFVEVVRGPKENGHRPAVDPLFRSASWSYGSRVVGVILSGHLDCGTAGLMSVKARGGVAVVQDPLSAAAPDMPQSAIRRVEVDYVVEPADLPKLITRLTAEAASAASPPGQAVAALEGARPGARAELVCPVCHGVLTETAIGDFRHFRCHVGHAFTLESLLGEQGEELERALWAAVRSLEEGAALARRLARTQPTAEMRDRFAEKEGTLSQQADVIRRLLLYGQPRLEEEAPGKPAGGEQPGA